jgi:hypothetical protein
MEGGSLEPVLIKVPKEDVEEEALWENDDVVVVKVETVMLSILLWRLAMDDEILCPCHHAVDAGQGHAVNAGGTHAVGADDRVVVLTCSEKKNDGGYWCWYRR